MQIPFTAKPAVLDVQWYLDCQFEKKKLKNSRETSYLAAEIRKFSQKNFESKND
jgi:hypothetical protein